MITPERTPFVLVLEKRALKALKPLSTQDEARVWDALLRLCAEGIGDIGQLQNEPTGSLRLRVGDMRIFLFLEGHSLTLVDLERRGQAYKTKSRKSRAKRQK